MRKCNIIRYAEIIKDYVGFATVSVSVIKFTRGHPKPIRETLLNSSTGFASTRGTIEPVNNWWIADWRRSIHKKSKTILKRLIIRS